MFAEFGRVPVFCVARQKLGLVHRKLGLVVCLVERELQFPAKWRPPLRVCGVFSVSVKETWIIFLVRF